MRDGDTPLKAVIYQEKNRIEVIDKPVLINLRTFNFHELDLIGSRVYNQGDFGRAIELAVAENNRSVSLPHPAAAHGRGGDWLSDCGRGRCSESLPELGGLT